MLINAPTSKAPSVERIDCVLGMAANTRFERSAKRTDSWKLWSEK